MHQGTGWKLGAIVMALIVGTGAWATDYTDTTATYDLYSLSDQTDTWTRCVLTVTKLYVASNVNSVAELRLVSTTNNVITAGYVGYGGPGTLRAENSRLGFPGPQPAYWGSLYVGYGTNNGVFYMTDSTGVCAGAAGAVLMLGRGNGGTSATTVDNVGTMCLLRSVIEKGPGASLSICLGASSGEGRLFATNSQITASSISQKYNGVYDGQVRNGYALFDNSTVTLGSCVLGGQPSWGPCRGDMLLTNNSVMTISGGFIVGYAGGSKYTNTVEISGSQLTVGGNVKVGDNGFRGLGRLTLKDGTTAQCLSNLILGEDYSGGYSKGFLDVLSGSRLDVTNAAGNAALVVGQAGYGLLTVTGASTCRVDQLVLTNGANSVLAFSNGMLSVKSGIISNGLTTVIGDGANSATLDLWGRQPFNVTSNLVFTNGATLMVEVGGATTNDCNFLDVHGTLTFYPGTTLALSLTNDYTPLPGSYTTVAIADTLSTKPSILPQRYKAYIVDEGSRKALKIFRIPICTIFTVN